MLNVLSEHSFNLVEKKSCHCFTYNTVGSSVVPVFVSVISSIDVPQMIDLNMAQLFLLTRHFRTVGCYNKY